jgi:integrase
LHDTHGIEPSALVVKATRGGRGPEKVERVLREYCRFLTDKKGQNERSAIQWYSVLRGFFTANKANLGRYPDFGVQSGPDETRALTQDKVKRMVKSYDDPPERFLLAFFEQTGQRIGVLTAMKRNMITKGASGHGIVKVPEKFRDPEGENVNTFEHPYTFIVGRETMQLLQELDKWLSDKHLSYEGGWLFNLSKRQMARIIDNAAQAVHIQEKEHTKIGRWLSVIHPETFRKYWKESMMKAGSNPRCFMHMLGLRVPSTLGNREPTDEELLEAYMQAEPMLEVL